MMGRLGGPRGTIGWMSNRLETWQRMGDPDLEPLLAAAASLGAPGIEPAQLERLRAVYGRDEVEIVLELTSARRKAAAKFSAFESLMCDVSGVEQASGDLVAQHKAARFQGVGAVLDLCCGIGGDTMALAESCSDVRAVDIDPVRAWMAGVNGGVEARVQDVADLDCRGTHVHVDPARRQADGRRLWRYADLEPGPKVFEPILSAASGAAIKLGPGVDSAELPEMDTRELEFIGGRGGLLQAVLWCGDLARRLGQHTATRLDSSSTTGLSYSAVPTDEVSVAERPGGFILVPDPALERARLIGTRIEGTPARELAPGLGILTSDVRLEDPWFEEHEILATLPWRPRKIREWLRGNDGGLVTIRSRGGAVDTDRAQLELRGDGEQAYTLFGLRLARRVVCLVVPG